MPQQVKAKSNKQRQAEYRARRKEQRLCAWPGCDRKPTKYALCPEHRKASKEAAAERRADAAEKPELEGEIDRLKLELQYTRVKPEARVLAAFLAESERQLAELRMLTDAYKEAMEGGFHVEVEGEQRVLAATTREARAARHDALMRQVEEDLTRERERAELDRKVWEERLRREEGPAVALPPGSPDGEYDGVYTLLPGIVTHILTANTG